MHEVKINPQTIWLKSLVGTICSSVKFIGPLDDVRLSKTDLRGSAGAKINPKTVYKGVIDDSILIDAEIIESMKEIRVTGGIAFIYNPKNQSETDQEKLSPPKQKRKINLRVLFGKKETKKIVD